MTPREKLAEAKAKLMLEHPYLGALAAGLETVEESETLTFRSDGETLRYNPEYFEQAPSDELMFALANGALHIMFHHTQRKARRVTRIWQAAIDIAVNAILRKNGFSLPPYAYYDERFEGMYAEEIYAVLTEEMRENDSSDPETEADERDTDTTKNLSRPRTIPPSQRDEKSESDAEIFEALFRKYEKQQALPEGLEILLPHLYRSRIDWRTRLHRYLAEYLKTTYRFLPPNMKYLYRGMVLPSAVSDTVTFVVAVDSSGSIDERLLGRFLAEVEAIVQSFDNYRIECIVADDRIRSHTTFYPGEPLHYRIEGGGGTDFRPVFTYVENRIYDPKLLLYFTDAQGTFPRSAPPYDTLWVLPTEREIPFGERLVLGD